MQNCISSPSGKLVQIEYALAAVAAGAPSVGIKGNHTLKWVFYGIFQNVSVFP